MIDWSVEVEGERQLDRLWAGKVMGALGDGIKNGVECGMAAGVEEARKVHPYTDRSGDLAKDGKYELYSVSLSGEAANGEMYWITPYAAFVEFGTRPHVIEASGLRGGDGPMALHFMWKGVEVFFGRVHHPGGKPYPFAVPALRWTLQVALANIETGILNAAKILWEDAA